MNFVDDIDFEAGFGRGVTHLFTQVTDVVNAGVAGGIDFNDIQCPSPGDCLANIAGVARLALTAVIQAVYGFRQYSPGACLSRAPRSAEEIGVG